MNRIKIKHIPPGVKNLWGVLFMVTSFAAFIALEFNHVKIAAVTGFSAIGCLMILIDLSCCMTTIIYGDSDIIRCRWKNKKWKIDLAKTEYVVWKLTTVNGRTGYRHYLSVEFVYSDENGGGQEKLEICLDADESKKYMLGNADDIPLMQLYRYIEENYPEKARGNAKV